MHKYTDEQMVVMARKIEGAVGFRKGRLQVTLLEHPAYRGKTIISYAGTPDLTKAENALVEAFLSAVSKELGGSGIHKMSGGTV